jgi:hypothetical protein
MIEINVAKEEGIDVEINGEKYAVGGLTPAEIQKAVEEVKIQGLRRYGNRSLLL